MNTLWRALPVIPFLAGLAWAGDDEVQILQFLDSTGADADATCRARWRQDGDDTDFNIELEDLPQGTYEFWVAGVQHESVEVGALGEGETEWQTPQDGAKPLFDFEVLDQLLEIRQGATTFFSDVFDGSGSAGGGSGGGVKAHLEMFMVNVGPDANAKGKVEHETLSGKVKFKIEVEHLDAGTYQLQVAGAPVAELVVTGLELELEFQDPVEPGKLLLNFDPLGAQLDVVKDGVTYLSIVLPAAGGGATGGGQTQAKDVGKTQGDALLVALQNSGLLPGAHGTVKLSTSGEVELEVEIEDLPDGDYGLSIAGAPVATITVVAQHGEVQVVNPPEVQGQLVAVTSGADTVLSTLFPVSVQAALGQYKKEVHKASHVSINLASTGADLDARGRLVFKDKSSHDSLVVKLSDLDAGSYDLILGGTTKAGVLVVTKQDGKAKVTFDTSPKGAKLLLDVAMPGTLVEITPAGDPLTVLLTGTVE